MKNTLALAPAVALALTGLAASPVIAAPTGDSPAASQPAAPAALKKASAQSVAAPQAAGIKVSAESVTLAEFADPGVGIVGAELKADTEYKVVTAPSDGQQVNPNEQTVTTNAEGNFETGVKGADNEAFLGGYTVTVTNAEDSNEVHTATFQVTAGDDEEPEAPVIDPKVSLDTDKVSVSDFEKDGLKVSGEGFTPGKKVTLLGNAAQSPFFQEEVTADDEGKINATVTAPESGLEPGEYSVSAVDVETEEVSNYASFNVVADDTEAPTTPAAEAKLSVSPETISPADFVKEDKGVTLAVENCEPGEDVHYVVNPKGESNVTAYENTVKADDEGRASVNVYGTSASDPSAYLGDYDVTVTCGDAELTGEFTVSDDANAGGSDGNEDGSSDGGDNGDGGNGGGDLPRTGTELTGLVGGGALLLIGAAAVTMTLRRKKVAQDPAEI